MSTTYSSKWHTRFPAIGTADWDRMNLRRTELIDKKVANGVESLTPEEFEEYEALQRLTQEAIEKSFSRSVPDLEHLERLEKELRDGSEAHG
jgi:hypothetical protein